MGVRLGRTPSEMAGTTAADLAELLAHFELEASEGKANEHDPYAEIRKAGYDNPQLRKRLEAQGYDLWQKS